MEDVIQSKVMGRMVSSAEERPPVAAHSVNIVRDCSWRLVQCCLVDHVATAISRTFNPLIFFIRNLCFLHPHANAISRFN